MKGRIFRKTAQVYRDRHPGPREMKIRDLENLYEKAEASSKPKPRPPASPQELKKP